MSSCCQEKSCDMEVLGRRHRRVLWIVFWINGGMFFLEGTLGLLADSTALLGDSLDMLGDAVAYGTSLWALRPGDQRKARAAQIKGFLMLILGIAVFARALYRFALPQLPETELMTLTGIGALAANGFCLLLLSRYREDDINMNSVWICSRNDIIANVSVLGAAGAVATFNSPIPDLLVGAAISILFIYSALVVLRRATTALHV